MPLDKYARRYGNQYTSNVYIDFNGENHEGKPYVYVSPIKFKDDNELMSFIESNPDYSDLIKKIYVDPMGISFLSLASERAYMKTDTGALIPPIDMSAFALRVIVATWNYRARLNDFINKLKSTTVLSGLIKDDGTIDEDVYKKIKDL
jgi:hypothetical protein